MKNLVFASLPVVFAAAFLALPWERDLIYGFEPGSLQTPDSGPVVSESFTRSTVYFSSHGTKCEAWLYLPQPALEKPPVVIMAHGLGGQKDMALHRYAERFAADGIASFVFDYRTFGGSEGLPRHWVSPRRHLQDWEASYHHIKATAVDGQVDSSRIALWGTSFAGGHVLVTANKPGVNVTAVISQVPHLDGTEAAKKRLKVKGFGPALRLLAVGVHDSLRHTLGLTGAYIRLVGGYSDLALMQMEEEQLKTYFAKHPPVRQGGWKNQVLGRVVFELSGYNPIHSLQGIRAPVLLVAAEKDHLCPGPLVKAAADRLNGRATILSRDCNHFEIYRGEHFDVVSEEMAAFLRQHLAGGL